MRHAVLVLAIALAAANTQARAELVTYTMTGTIQSSQNFGGLAGDRISWTLQYNNSLPMYANGSSGMNYYPSTPVITNLIDRTSGGFPFFLSSSVDSTLRLNNASATLYPNSFVAGAESTTIPGYPEGILSYGLVLNNMGSLPTMNLASLQLNTLPLNLSASSFNYSFAEDLGPFDQQSFVASVDSISAPVYGAPEPGSLTLFLLGAFGVAAHGMRRRLGQVA
jgi:hypothetical protein